LVDTLRQKQKEAKKSSGKNLKHGRQWHKQQELYHSEIRTHGLEPVNKRRLAGAEVVKHSMTGESGNASGSSKKTKVQKNIIMRNAITGGRERLGGWNIKKG
jgi:hypothetical protein